MQQILQLENANMLLFIVKNYIFLRGMYKHVFVFKISFLIACQDSTKCPVGHVTKRKNERMGKWAKGRARQRKSKSKKWESLREREREWAEFEKLDFLKR